MKNKRALGIIIPFLILLYLPVPLAWVLGTWKIDDSYKAPQAPALTLDNITTYPVRFEGYFNDNLPFLAEIRKARNGVMRRVFNVASVKSVLQGKNDWLFYNSGAKNDGDTIGDLRKNSMYTEKDLNNAVTNLKNADNKLKERGIELYVMAVPNKENVYSDYLPDDLTFPKGKKSRVEVLVDKLRKETDVPTIYPKKQLLAGRDLFDTYYQYGTHWNDYGAYIGTVELMKKVDSNFDMLTDSVDIHLEDVGGSVGDFLADAVGVIPRVGKFYEDVKIKCETVGKYERAVSECTSNGPIDKRILIVGDSYREAMLQYLQKIYKNSMHTHRSDLTADMIDKYKPDVVVFVTVERYGDSLLDIESMLKL